MANNNYPQITSITSESLQAQIRNLLPSQQGFGTDLMAQNVIVPVIDLTATAAGTTTPEYMQRALSFDSQTAFSVAGSSSVLANTPGFWQIQGVSSTRGGSFNTTTAFSMSDGLSTKQLWAYINFGGSAEDSEINYFEFVVFLNSGESVTATTNSADAALEGTYRQIATVNGTLVNPAGFSPQ